MAKKEQYDLHELYRKLSDLVNRLEEASEKLIDIKDYQDITVAGAGFKAGQAYAIIDKVYEDLDEIADDVDRHSTL